MARKKWEGSLPYFYATHDVPFSFIGSTYNKPKLVFIQSDQGIQHVKNRITQSHYIKFLIPNVSDMIQKF